MFVSTRGRCGGVSGGGVAGEGTVYGLCFLAFKQRAIIDWTKAGIATGSRPISSIIHANTASLTLHLPSPPPPRPRSTTITDVSVVPSADIKNQLI